MRRLGNGGEPRLEMRSPWKIIKRKDTHLVRNGDTKLSNRTDQAERHLVIAGEYGGRRLRHAEEFHAASVAALETVVAALIKDVTDGQVSLLHCPAESLDAFYAV